MPNSQFRSLLLAPIIIFSLPPQLFAQNQIPSISCEIPPQLELLENPAQLRNLGIISAYPIETIENQHPDLWWAKEQFDTFDGNLIINWLIYPEQQQIDLIVNRQIWTGLTYLDQYRLVNQFGTVARSYGYDLRVFNQQKFCLAIYNCNFSTTKPQCEINLKPSNSGSFRL